MTLTLPPKAFVICEWADAHGSATDTYSEKDIPHEPTLILTAGWLLRQDERGISIACEYCGASDYRGITFVPAAMINEVRIIKKAPGAKRQRPPVTSAAP
jgi:hypothetical protein